MKKLCIGIAVFCLSNPSAWAWEIHKNLMPWVVRGLSAETLKAIENPFKPQEQGMQNENTLSHLIMELQLNPKTKLDPLNATHAREILLSGAVDEPDHGMDENLEDSADPRNDRAYMGGKTGPTSKGFRHMFFAGWNLAHPIRSFQIPPRPLGLAPERAEILAKKARFLLQIENRAWGFRVLTWAMHFIQDLSQPFHSTQIPSLEIPLWSALLGGFGNLVKESTRTVANFHWAYEGYVNTQVLKGDRSPFADCLTRAKNYASIKVNRAEIHPRELADAISAASVELAPTVGDSVVEFFGAKLKNPEYDLPKDKGTPDYEKLSVDPTLAKQRQKLEQVTCVALANGVMGSRLLLDWAIQAVLKTNR